MDRFPDPVEQALDSGDAAMRRAASVIAALDTSMARSRAILAVADDTLDLARRAAEGSPHPA